MIPKNNARRLRFATCLGVLATAAAAKADIAAWFELVHISGEPAGSVERTQGGPGQPLVITLDAATGTSRLTVRLVAEADELFGYSVDLIAPNNADVAVTSLNYPGMFESDAKFALGRAPGHLIDDAGQWNTGKAERGMMDLIEFELTIAAAAGDQLDDVEIYSGIGSSEWESPESHAQIRFGDGEPLDAEATGRFADRPAIVIKRRAASPLTQPTGMEPGLRRTDRRAASVPSKGPNEPSALLHFGLDGHVDRPELRRSLAVIFAVPFEDVHPVATVPVKVLGLLGLNASVMLGITDLYALPFRMIAFELTFAILDHTLP